jgi:alpha-galactosidase
MAGDMIRVVRDYGVDWLKWDYNIGYGLGCDASNHGHQSTDGHHAHTLGLYSVLEDLRESCPDLLIENCASGGHRVDLGTLRHTHTNWVSDYTHRAANCRQHAQGAGLFLPLSHLNTWALDERDATEFRSRMGGAFGISSFIGSWSLDERAQFRQAVEEYKRLRPLLYGDRFLLTGPLHQDWDIWQFLHPSGNELAILSFHEAGEIAEVRVTPRVPVRDRSYRVQHSDAGTSEEVSGAALASNGIIICLPEKRASEIIRVTAVD